MRTSLALAVLVWSSLPAQDSRRAPDDAEVERAIAQATQLLCGLQENYVETRPPRTRFKNDEERKAHEEKVKAAEAEKSKEIGPPREWPYEGVVRVAGLIPQGYRVGGTAICCWATLESPGFDAAGRCSEDRIRTAVGAFFDNWEWLEKRRKQTGTHVPPYMIAPYYFHYAHTYVAQAIEMLPEAERPPLRQKLRALYWQTREKDGGWNDRIFPRSEGYGTAMAILGLLMPDLPPPARWQPKAGTASRTKK
jgi:hypothetical protein